jgi:hypothetical protein
MINLLGILVVWKGQFSPKCVLGSFFAINGKKSIEILITVQETVKDMRDLNTSPNSQKIWNKAIN